MGERIRILFAIDGLVRGGTELQLAGLISRLDETKYEPYLLTLRPTVKALVPSNCRLFDWDVPRLASPAGFFALKRLVRLLRRERIGVVQTYFQDSTLLVGAAARLAGVPVRIACFRDMGFWSNTAQDLFLRMVYGQMTCFVANSGAVRQHFINKFGLGPSRVHVIWNGIDPEALPYVSPEGVVQHVGIVGNMTRHVKRVDLFVRAAAIVSRKYPQVTWHVVGDGELREGLERLAAELGVRPRMVFAGSVSDVPGYLRGLQIGVICSDSEGLSNALVEYMFAGVAVVATDVGGNPELVTHGKTGLLIPPDDEVVLASAISELIETPALRERLALSARSFVESSFSWEHCLEQYRQLYRFPECRGEVETRET